VVVNARHTQLRELDLTHVDEPVSGADLLALCKALPHLRTLRLPSFPQPQDNLTLAAVAAATSHLPALEALHVLRLSDTEGGPLLGWPVEGWSRLQELALPRALVVAASSASFSCFGALSRLCIRGHGDIDLAHVASVAAQLPALVALEQHGGCSTFDSGAQLHTLTQLTALRLTGVVVEEGRSTTELLRRIGPLTRLRSLHLKLWWGNDLDAATPDWLAQLTCLSSLRVDFSTTDEEPTDEGGLLDGVASSVPHLPALRELHIGDHNNVGAPLSPAACARIASAAGSLGLLTLGGVSLPPTIFTEVLPQLTRLTCLCLNSVYHEDTPTLGWLAALTNLRELGYVGNRACSPPPGDLLPCDLLGGLSNVVALTLAQCPFVDAPYVRQLCASMQQLRRLDLRDNDGAGAGTSALVLLTNLEVLGLQRSATVVDEVWKHVNAPSSLMRCYLGSYLAPQQKEAMAMHFFERNVQVVFQAWPHEWQDTQPWDN
jgi:hypothetical protein